MQLRGCYISTLDKVMQHTYVVYWGVGKSPWRQHCITLETLLMAANCETFGVKGYGLVCCRGRNSWCGAAAELGRREVPALPSPPSLQLRHTPSCRNAAGLQAILNASITATTVRVKVYISQVCIPPLLADHVTCLSRGRGSWEKCNVMQFSKSPPLGTKIPLSNYKLCKVPFDLWTHSKAYIQI